MVFIRPRLHSEAVSMCAHEIMKTSFAKETRSVLHRLVTAALPFVPEPDARSEILGGVMVVSLATTMVVLMRFLLAN